MSEQKCLICLQALSETDVSPYHRDCCRQLFGRSEAPVLPYSWDGLNALAEQIVRRHVAVPGVQPKLSLHLERGRKENGRLTLVGLEGDYILKAPVLQYPEMPELEHVTMRMARVLGIATCECGLMWLEGGQLAFIARRMDRTKNAKLQMEDMCQLTDRLTERKYAGSMEQVGKVVLRHCQNSLFDVLRLFELTIFCFLTGNADMHFKNFSLLYPLGGPVQLAPAYDLLPTALLLPEDREESALTLNGKKRRLSWDDFVAFGRHLHLNDKQITNVFKRIENQFPAAMRLLDSGYCSAEVLDRYKALLLGRAARLGMLCA